MRHVGCCCFPGWLLGTISFLILAAQAQATDTEHRDFSIFVEGKEIGTSKMTIVQQDDGSAYVTVLVEAKFRRLISDVTVKLETREWWKNGRLIGLSTNATENGKKTEVVVGADGNQLRIRVNGAAGRLQSDLWANTYWKLADARFHNKQLPVLEVDTGREFNCDLKFVDNQRLKIGRDFEECYHFRVTGGTGPVDLWFDRYHRLVRQEFMEYGHKTIVQLVTIRR